MITFPNAKINIGLNVLNKRPDGYHNIESLFFPIPLEDALEIIPNSSGVEFSSSGLDIQCSGEDNLVLKAYRLLQSKYKLPDVKIHLHKNIPFGAGLGGGSADASFALNILNIIFEMGVPSRQLKSYAAVLGADCPFFIDNSPCIVTGIGDELTPFLLDLSGYYLLLVKPDIKVATPDAYKYVIPAMPENALVDVLQQPVEEWKDLVKNDFEPSVFRQFPMIERIKQQMYELGAVYASMSGSGSSVYGVFKQKPSNKSIFVEHFCFETQL